jgi:hypothetical protein
LTTQVGSYTSSAGTVVVVTATDVVGATVVAFGSPGAVDAVLVDVEPDGAVAVEELGDSPGSVELLDVDARTVVEGRPVVEGALVATAVVTAVPSPSPPASAPLHAAMTNRHEENSNPPDARRHIASTVPSAGARVASAQGAATRSTCCEAADRSSGR